MDQRQGDPQLGDSCSSCRFLKAATQAETLGTFEALLLLEDYDAFSKEDLQLAHTGGIVERPQSCWTTSDDHQVKTLPASFPRNPSWSRSHLSIFPSEPKEPAFCMDL